MPARDEDPASSPTTGHPRASVHLERLRTIWTVLQAAESSLMAAALDGRRADLAALRASVGLDPLDFMLLARVGFGLDQTGFKLDDYLDRYRFGDRAQLALAVGRLTDAASLESVDERFRLSPRGRDLLERYQAIVAAGSARLELPSVTSDELAFMLHTEQSIVVAVLTRAASQGATIAGHRRAAFLPTFDPPALWHHWQLTWSLVTAEEDAEQAVQLRHDRSLSALAWFVRRQMWLGRFPARTSGELLTIATRYAPLGDGDRAIALALEELELAGSVQRHDGGWRLTSAGRARGEELARKTQDLFLGWWPRLEDSDADRLLAVATQLNGDLAARAPNRAI